ncbi:MAG: hypothetical protein QOH26_269, partial [Actinomycetota bacterium]|nr:hypothetical protein [Actinomycetota bacterium]
MQLFRKVAGSHSPILDRTLPPLTRSANYSQLWMTIAALMWVFGGRFHRRAALRGMFGLSLASWVANLPAKLMTRRVRPLIDVVPEARRLARLPRSSSFPSGHSASAFGFAVGAALEAPHLALPL